jgi:hypothetical protein
MRFVGPISPNQIRGPGSPIDQLRWMLGRVELLVERQLEADRFHNLEVKLIPRRNGKIIVADYADRDPLMDYEKVYISIPDKPQEPWFSPKGERIKVHELDPQGVSQGVYQILGRRLD